MPRLLVYNAHKRMSAMLKPITNYGFPHSLTTRVKTAFSRGQLVVTTVQAIAFAFIIQGVLISKRRVDPSLHMFANI